MIEARTLYVAYCPKCGISKFGVARDARHRVNGGGVAKALAAFTHRDWQIYAFSLKHLVEMKSEREARLVERHINKTLRRHAALFGSGWYDGCPWEKVVSTVKQAVGAPPKLSIPVGPPRRWEREAVAS